MRFVNYKDLTELLQKKGLLAFLLGISISLFAENRFGEVIRNSHKFHVSTAVIFVILTGFLFYVVFLEIKVRKLYKSVHSDKKNQSK